MLVGSRRKLIIFQFGLWDFIKAQIIWILYLLKDTFLIMVANITSNTAMAQKCLRI